MPQSRIVRLVSALLLCLLSSAAYAQSGSIHLEVKDPSGAGLASAGTLTGPILRSFRTDARGVVSLSSLPVGLYQVDIRRSGFEAQTVTLDLRQTKNVTRTVTLSIQALATSVYVISSSPIGKAEIPLSEVPVTVQSVTAQNMQDENALDLAAAMNKRMNGVYINDNANNPFEPDINYRGYTASPLLGTPIGLSVYLDGVRQNQPFGDIVTWDLIPKVAIRDAELIPGSNPVYGLNTLGGAVVVRTKDGTTNPGLSVEAVGGAFGRRSVEGQYGGSNGRHLDWFTGGNFYQEDGWRQMSASQVRQSFAKLRWTDAKTTVAVSGAYAINFLTGNGLQDFRALARSYSSVYSVPDITWNHSPSLTINASRDVNPHLVLSGNTYARHVRSDTTNGDINDDSFDQSLYNLSKADIAALTAAGYSGFPTTGTSTTEPFPKWRCIAQALEKDEPTEKCTGIITNTRTQQNNEGFSLLASTTYGRNRLAFGAAWDHSSISYGQLSQWGYLNPDGITITAVDAYADGSTNDDGDPVDTRVQLYGTVNTGSFYATDTLMLGPVTITASGRYNRTSINNLDRLPASDVRGTLTAKNAFERFNPSVGAVYHTHFPFSVYADYSEASRAPTSIELGCADPNFPCNLPNALVSDPPLQQVVSRTVEAGIRSREEGPIRWSADYFLGNNENDLLFVSSGQLGFGYFLNFGQTRRQGVELNLSGEWHKVSAGAGYTFLRATYQTAQTLDGGNNSTNASNLAGTPGMDDDITILPGDRIPQTPQHLLKVFADYKPFKNLTIDADVVAVSSAYARGNENNLDKPDGVYYLGSGTSAGYGVANLGARYQVRPRVQVFMQVDNVLNHHYATAAQLGSTPFDNNGNFIARPFPAINGNYPLRSTTFVSPGAPIDVFGGLRIRLK